MSSYNPIRPLSLITNSYLNPIKTAESAATPLPWEAFHGVTLPFGGAKGASLALVMDIFSGLFTGVPWVERWNFRLEENIWDIPKNTLWLCQNSY